MRSTNHSGFSLIELMIVIAIIGVAAGVALPSMRDFMRLSEVKAAATEVVGAMATARNEAMKFGNNVGLRLQSGKGFCALYVADSTLAAIPACNLDNPDAATVRLWDQKSNVVYTVATSSGIDTIVFNRSGRLNSSQSTGCVQVKAVDADTLRRCVRVTSGGGISTDSSPSCSCT